MSNGYRPRQRSAHTLWLLMVLVLAMVAGGLFGYNIYKRHETKASLDSRVVETIPLPVPAEEPEVLEPLSDLPRDGKVRNRNGKEVVYRVFEVEGMPCLWIWKTGMSCDWRRFNVKTKEGANR